MHIYGKSGLNSAKDSQGPPIGNSTAANSFEVPIRKILCMFKHFLSTFYLHSILHKWKNTINVMCASLFSLISRSWGLLHINIDFFFIS